MAGAPVPLFLGAGQRDNTFLECLSASLAKSKILWEACSLGGSPQEQSGCPSPLEAIKLSLATSLGSFQLLTTIISPSNHCGQIWVQKMLRGTNPEMMSAAASACHRMAVFIPCSRPKAVLWHPETSAHPCSEPILLRQSTKMNQGQRLAAEIISVLKKLLSLR